MIGDLPSKRRLTCTLSTVRPNRYTGAAKRCDITEHFVNRHNLPVGFPRNMGDSHFSVDLTGKRDEIVIRNPYFRARILWPMNEHCTQKSIGRDSSGDKAVSSPSGSIADIVNRHSVLRAIFAECANRANPRKEILDFV